MVLVSTLTGWKDSEYNPQILSEDETGTVPVYTPNFEPLRTFPQKHLKVVSQLEQKNIRLPLGTTADVSYSTSCCALCNAVC